MAILFEEVMNINGSLRTLEMESYSQFTNQFVVAVSTQLNAMSKRGSNLTGFKHLAREVILFYCARFHQDLLQANCLLRQT